MKPKGLLYGALLLLCVPAVVVTAWAAEKGGAENKAKGPVVVRAVMCESIEDYVPKHIAVVFSINVGKISCYTSFSQLTDTTYTVHKWYRHDELVTTKRLTLKPPSWSTYSSIQLREADKGPWRVEVWNADDHLLKVLRFSVTD